MTARVSFAPSGRSADVETGTTVLDAARALGVDLDSVCGGRMICGRCQVVLPLDAPGAVSALTASERDGRTARPLAPGHRLACAVRCDADVRVDVPPASRVHHPVVRKAIALPDFDVDPRFALHYLELAPNDLATASSATGRIDGALAEQHGLNLAGFSASVLGALHRATEQSACTVAIDAKNRTVIAAWPGYVDAIFGVAVDIGSTTIAAYLCDLSHGEVLANAGAMNPQIRFGDDLMSRVAHVMMHPGSDREMTSAVRTTVDALIDDLLARAGDVAELERSRILEVVVVGNPVMHHLMLGIDPTPLGTAPFTLATSDAVEMAARDLGLGLPFARVYIGPCIAGHVGADAAAAGLAQRTFEAAASQLLVDIGTNAELLLASGGRVFAASSPTGPAFEGGQLSCGMRAAPGAIERVRIDPATLEPTLTVIGGGAPTGLCGSGVLELIGELFLVGVIDARGVIGGAPAAHSDRVVADGRTFRYVVVAAGDGQPEVSLTQNDVRAIQLAKAALRAGADLLMEHAGLARIDDVRIAGAFGAHVDARYARLLGLVPVESDDAIQSVGNAAGAGAVVALLSMTERAALEAAVGAVTRIETATEPRFQELFVAAMAIPHSSAAPAPITNRTRRTRRP